MDCVTGKQTSGEIFEKVTNVEAMVNGMCNQRNP